MGIFGRRPRFLSELMPEFIDRSPQRERFIQEMVLSIFHETVGERISEQVEKVFFQGRTLIIRVPSAVWRQELHMQRPAIRAKLNAKVGEQAVSDIRVVG